MWIGLRQSVAPGLEDTYKRFLERRGPEIAELGRRHGLRQMHVFQQGTQGFMAIEVDDPAAFGHMSHDPDFQEIAQEMASIMNFQPFREGQFWEEVFSWEPAGVG